MMKIQKTPKLVGRFMLTLLLVGTTFCLSSAGSTVCAEEVLANTTASELQQIESRVSALCSMPKEAQMKDPFYQTLMNMKEKDYSRILKRFEDSDLSKCLLGIRETSPFITSNEWGDWEDQALAFSPPPGGFHAPGASKKIPLVPDRNFASALEESPAPAPPTPIGDGVDLGDIPPPPRG